MIRYFMNMQGKINKLSGCVDLDSKTVMGFHVGKPGSAIYRKVLECDENGVFLDDKKMEK